MKDKTIEELLDIIKSNGRYIERLDNGVIRITYLGNAQEFDSKNPYCRYALLGFTASILNAHNTYSKGLAMYCSNI